MSVESKIALQGHLFIALEQLAAERSKVALLEAGIEGKKQLLRDYQKDPYIFGEQHDEKIKREVAREIADYVESFKWAAFTADIANAINAKFGLTQ